MGTMLGAIRSGAYPWLPVPEEWAALINPALVASALITAHVTSAFVFKLQFRFSLESKGRNPFSCGPRFLHEVIDQKVRGSPE